MVEVRDDKAIKTAANACNLKHIAIIMDGNRRWAKEKKLPVTIGHKHGVTALKNTLRASKDFGIKYVTVYAFSTENWKRAEEEVKFLMDLLIKTMQNEIEEMHKECVRIRFIGDRSVLSEKMQKVMKDSEDKTANNTDINLQIAFNYGSRDEIKNAVKKIVEQNISAEDITEELISKNLYTADIPDPDMLIRTGDEKRISNFLLWQIAYSELVSVPVFWPDFDKESLIDCILAFIGRKRRFGK